MPHRSMLTSGLWGGGQPTARGPSKRKGKICTKDGRIPEKVTWKHGGDFCLPTFVWTGLTCASLVGRGQYRVDQEYGRIFDRVITS